MLSVLICTLPQRLEGLADLLNTLIPQSHFKPVEILYLGDTQTTTVGEKRNKLMSIASGEYIVFIDDDDHVSDDYIDTILSAMGKGTDVITIGGHQTNNRDEKTRAEFNFNSNVGTNHNFRDRATNKFIYHRLPNHICVWKKEIAQRVQFEKRNLGEDHIWAEKQRLLGYSEHHIRKDIYHYDFNRDTTETRK